MSFERELDVAREAAKSAAHLCEEVRRELVPASLTKKDRSPVTVADYGAQALVCRALAAAFPNDPVVGEEDAAALKAPENAESLARVVEYVGRQVGASGSGVKKEGGAGASDGGPTAAEVCAWIDHGNGSVGARYWTLDPIDGTKGFLRGDQYAVALALVVGGDLKVGVLACPYLPVTPGDGGGARGMLFWATRGGGAWAEELNGGAGERGGGMRGGDMNGGGPQRLRVVDGAGSPSFRMVESVESGHGDHSLQGMVAHAVGIRAASVRMDSQAKYGAVARGEAALYLRLPSPKTPDYRENIWDHAAGVLLVEEAGGRVTDVRGKALDFAGGARMTGNRGVVVSNGAIHDGVLRELGRWWG